MSTKIEWTDETWNPMRGCSLVSPGCTNCYAMRQAHRFSGPGQPYEGLTQPSKAGPVWTGKVRLVPELLDAPLRWKRPRRIFVNSMSDLFHEDVPDSFIEIVFAVMANHDRHTYQVLTKRSERMRRFMQDLTAQKLAELIRLGHGASEKWITRDGDQSGWTTAALVPQWPLPNVWLGVSVEDQARADERIPLLLQTPAAVRWISAEPLLGPVSLRWIAAWNGKALKPGGPGTETDHLDGARCLDWVVAGGESGSSARPMHPDWVRSLRDQCAAARVPFFFKQWGAYAPRFPQYRDEYGLDDNDDDACAGRDFPDEGVLYRDGYFYDGVEHQPHTNAGAFWVERVGKAAAGRHLDGRTHDEYPR